jgi:hypothetical protein
MFEEYVKKKLFGLKRARKKRNVITDNFLVTVGRIGS